MINNIKAFAKFHKSHPEFKLEIYGRSVGDSITDLKHLANQVVFQSLQWMSQTSY